LFSAIAIVGASPRLSSTLGTFSLSQKDREMKRNLLHGLHILLWLGGKLSVVTQAISDSEWETGMVSRQGDGKGATNYRRTATQDDRKGATNYRRTATPTPTNVTVTVSEGTTSINDTLFDSITSSSGSLCDDKPIQTDRPDQLAAPWIAKKERRVLFVELHTWDLYYGPSKYKTGEYYVSATWDYALRKNGFRVERVSTRHYYEKMTNGEMLAYHRIFVRDPRWHRLYHQKEIMCKVRPMYYYGDWFYRKNDHNYRFQVPFAEKQILSAHIDARNTFMGYFPHNLLDNNESPSKERKKVGLLYGKKPEYFKGHEAVITSLIDSGFELHSTCNDPDCPLPEGVIRHGAMKPATYAGLMKQFSFMLGFQQPEVSAHISIIRISFLFFS
jgi:hypothetical protein